MCPFPIKQYLFQLRLVFSCCAFPLPSHCNILNILFANVYWCWVKWMENWKIIVWFKQKRNAGRLRVAVFHSHPRWRTGSGNHSSTLLSSGSARVTDAIMAIYSMLQTNWEFTIRSGDHFIFIYARNGASTTVNMGRRIYTNISGIV